ncbi:MAG: Uma2 family endonuclease [Acidobacteria bacterium]|nr:Uma2 family endonuclease [Acidobacteriota bacterium]
MSRTLTEIGFDLEDAERNLVTDDDEPVDNMFSAKQQRLLVEPLYASWTPPPSEDDEGSSEGSQGPRDFLADSNVGIFFSVDEQPLVPDMFLSLYVKVNPEWFDAQHRSYFVWRFGKVPDLVVEIVSNRKGGEMEYKRKRYAQIGVQYYIVYDPYRILKGDDLYIYEIGFGKRYRRRDDPTLPGIGLGVTVWQGIYEGGEAPWLRWCDEKGNLVATGKERATEAEHRASKAQDRASKAERRVSEAERLAADETEARRRAEAELAQLREELERLRQK